MPASCAEANREPGGSAAGTPRDIDPPSHERLVASLVSRLAAASPGAAPQVIQTHISTVILAGDLAWKIKRPVRLSFLDFSTLALRQHFCQEELRINRRLAPPLYLDVVPITGSVEAPVFDGPGAPIEYALRMRRFAAADAFKTLARAGHLRAAQVEALARYLAHFHLGLAPVPPEALETVAGNDVGSWAAESLAGIEGHPLRPASCSRDDLAALRTALEAFFARRASVMAQRLDEGFVRECHGDLHLGNIVLWHGEVLAFDAIEFDARLRCIDIVNDVAFTFMDLHAAGQPALAWRLINAWVEQTGDFDGLSLLHGYATYRAVVRARVALLSGDEETEFAVYWALAQQLIRPAASPRMVLTMGLSGSGKSTLAQFLAEDLGAVCLRSDVERKRLHGLAPTDRPAPALALYSAQATQRTYARLALVAGRLLEAGLSVVVDAAFLRQDERETLLMLARGRGADFSLVACVAPEAVLRARIVARSRAGGDPSDATLEVLALQQRIAQAVPDDWAPWHSVVVNEGSLDALHAQTQALVATWNGASRP